MMFRFISENFLTSSRVVCAFIRANNGTFGGNLLLSSLHYHYIQGSHLPSFLGTEGS
uniref:Uncharacterized protein n=1 Tax=Arundo donax TaxID=35708 RepID=A0A0A9HWT2_ARUDO